MRTYTKIETPFVRKEDGSKKLDYGVFRNETVEFLADSRWYGTEKIDGANIGIVWDGHSVKYQGRTERSQIPAHLTNKLVEIFGTNEAEEMFEQKFGETQVILFGEGYGAKIQKGGNYIPNGCDFILFDVYFPETDLWLKRDSIEDIANAFGIKCIPIVVEGTLNDCIEFVKSKPKSTIGTADMEGVVCKPMVDMYDRMHRRVMVKIKVCDFN